MFQSIKNSIVVVEKLSNNRFWCAKTGLCFRQHLLAKQEAFDFESKYKLHW